METRTLKILIAEDEPTSRKVVCRLLEALGCEVRAAVDGLQALEFFGRENFDCVIMDLFMPRMSGDQAIMAIRTAPEYRERADVPIFGLSAYDTSYDAKRFEGIEVNEWLMKPVELADLERITEFVRREAVAGS